MKKVFSKKKYCEVIEQKENEVSSWVNKCDGLTEEEINKLGYGVIDEWMIEAEDEPKEKDNKGSIDFKVNIDDEGLEDTVDMLREAADLLPNITIRNNEQVYVTINYFNTTAKEYYKEDE